MDNKQTIKLMKSIRNVYSWSVNCEKALDKAIASLEAWDKVIEEIENSKTNPLNQDPYIDMGLNKAIKIIEKYKKEIEE